MTTMTHTFESILTVYDVTIPEGLAADAEVPVLTGPRHRHAPAVFCSACSTSPKAPSPT
jgi:hypothetical protein